jgi:transposase-like protein
MATKSKAKVKKNRFVSELLNEDVLKQMIRNGDLHSVKDIEDILKNMFGNLLQQFLEAEMDETLGYSKYDYRNKNTDNSRNGYFDKQVRTSMGELDLSIPRDRKSEFEPKIVPKYSKDVSPSIEDRILSMYAKGMSLSDIHEHMKEIYGMNLSNETISRLTDRILPIVNQWRTRPLESIYAIMYMDGIKFKVLDNGGIKKKSVYVAIGINLDGMKDVLGMWISENETSKYWLNVLNELKNRGVKDILITAIDGLPGFEDAIKAVYPKAEVQRCVIHQLRNTFKYVPYKDKKIFANDFKSVYKSPTKDGAWNNFITLKEKWGKKYPLSFKIWEDNWESLTTYFKYPQEIRTLIYTTNPIESFNRQLRKVTKSKSVFPNDTSVFKMLYLATMDIVKKWTMRRKNWASILAQLAVYFKDRVEPYL